MKVRDATVVNKNLGLWGLPNGFVSVPVATYIGTDIDDDINGCTYANDVINQRWNDNANYVDFWWISDIVKDPLADAL